MSYFKFVHQNPRTLFGITRYVKDENKTNPPLLYGFGVNPEYAFEEMDAVKKTGNQTDGRQYKHFIFSFDSNTILPHDILMDVGYKIGAYYADEYQILMAMHLDTNNIHFHYILNTVNLLNGKKFTISKGEIYKYKLYINQILSHYRLPLIKLYNENQGGTEEAL